MAYCVAIKAVNFIMDGLDKAKAAMPLDRALPILIRRANRRIDDPQKNHKNLVNDVTIAHKSCEVKMEFTRIL